MTTPSFTHNSATGSIETAALLDAIAPLATEGAVPETVSGITDDSRAVVPGGVFVAVRGCEADGHRFIAGAARAGAAVVVAEDFSGTALPSDVLRITVADSREALGLMASRFFGDPSDELSLVGVTGTNGKTTVATLLYNMARAMGLRAGLLSTVANIVDTESTAAEHTTPHPIALNGFLRRMAEAGCTFAAMEVSSHAADQHRIAGLSFAGGVFTNLTRDHLDYHRTVEAYLKAKKSFFDGLTPQAFALVNADDRNGAVMLQNCPARHFTYSVRTTADFKARMVEDRIDGMEVEFGGTPVDTRFAGEFNASNLAAVYGTSLLMGWPREKVLTALSALTPVAGRFEQFRSADGVTAIVDFAHTPDALANVLDTIADIAPRDAAVWCVFGAGGNRDAGKRPLMARTVCEKADVAVLTSDNPRHENPDDIIADMAAGIGSDSRARVVVQPDRAAAIAETIAAAKAGDIVLVAGKGHETEQIIGDTAIHFDDRLECRRALERRAAGGQPTTNLR